MKLLKVNRFVDTPRNQQISSHGEKLEKPSNE